MRKTLARAAALALCVGLLSRAASAWVYPEHRGITLAAIEQLDPEQRRALDALWADAHAGQSARLCEAVAEHEQGERPRCIDYAAWPAIAGDHSCSSRQMVDTILQSRWVLAVAREAGKLGRRLRRAESRSDVVNALRDSDIDLQRSDPEYATRAGANNAHFLLARPSFATTPEGYVAVALGEGVELNALAVYLTYHTSALAKARALSEPTTSAARRAAPALAALADEAFALHFFQDAFAAGHVAGTRGSAALRKGTHDYYNEHGLEVSTWRGERAVLTGDAWMRPEDGKRAARAIAESLTQVIDAARGAGLAGTVEPARTNDAEPGGFDVCRATTVPARERVERELLAEVLLDTPVPMLATGLGEMPRFRAELGPFVGIAAAARSSTFTGGFAEPQDSPGALAGLELVFRVGFGLEGVSPKRFEERPSWRTPRSRKTKPSPASFRSLPALGLAFDLGEDGRHGRQRRAAPVANRHRDARWST